MAFFEHQADNVWTYLRESTAEQDKALYNELKVRPKNYFFDFRFRSGMSDGYERYFDLTNKRLLTGMIPWAKELGFNYEEVLLAKDPLEEFNLEFTLIDPENGKQLFLNSYQEEAIIKVAVGCRRGIFDHITAAGKTPTVAALCAMLKPLKTTITVPSVELLLQTSKDLSIMLGEPIGRIGNKKMELEPRITVVYDGFLKRYDKSPLVKNLVFDTQVLISDELQLVTKRLFPLLKKAKNAFYRFGLSGSFFDIDPARIFSVAGHFGGIITSVGDEQTKEEGRTVPPHFTFFEYPIRDSDLLYGEMYEELIVKNEGYNKFFAEKLKEEYFQGKTVLVLVKRVAHCNLFKRLLGDLGIEAEQYNGRIDTEKRQALKASFKSGLLPVLVATEQTMGVGVNIPRINLLLNLGGGLSEGATRQKYGRSLRSFTDKDHVEVWEPFITVNRIFRKHSKTRLAMAKRYSTGSVKMVWISGVEQVL